jgi:hypothetical protein
MLDAGVELRGVHDVVDVAEAPAEDAVVMALEFAWLSGGSGRLVSKGARRADDLDRPAVATLAHRPSVPASIDSSHGDQLDAEPAVILGRLRRTRRLVPLLAGQRHGRSLALRTCH